MESVTGEALPTADPSALSPGLNGGAVGSGVAGQDSEGPATLAVEDVPIKDFGISSSHGASENIPDLVVFGDPDTWKLVSKASSQSQQWMKSTKAMKVNGLGVLVQVTTQQYGQVAEAVTFVAGANLVEDTIDVPSEIAGEPDVKRKTGAWVVIGG